LARPKSEDKRNAILDAATRLFAERGLAGAPTSEISRLAGIAEGTLFTYFKNKDELINSLYREIKLELGDAVISDFPRRKNVRARLQHIWNRYVNWGIANHEQRKALTQLQLSDVLTRDSREAGDKPFVECKNTIHDAIGVRVLRDDLPHELVSKSFGALAEVAMELMALHPKEANQYRDTGFEMFWSAITRH